MKLKFDKFARRGPFGAAPLAKGGGEREETFTARVSASGVIFPGPISLRKIRRVSGVKAGTIRISDHPYGFVSALLRYSAPAPEAGGEVSFPTPLVLTNGGYLLMDIEGADLVVNGTFTSDTSGWAAQLGTTLSFNAGRGQGVTAGSAGRITQTVSGLEIGKTYKFTATLVSISGTVGQTASFRLTAATDGGATGQVWQSSVFQTGSAGTVTTSFVAAATSITVAVLQGTGLTTLVDSISLNELTSLDGEIEFEVAA